MRLKAIIIFLLLIKIANAEAGSAYDLNLVIGAIILIAAFILGILFLISYISKRLQKKKNSEESSL